MPTGLPVGAGYPDVSAVSANLFQKVGNIPNAGGGTSGLAPIFAADMELHSHQ